MASFPKIILRQNKADAVKRFHPWIFSGAVKSLAAGVQEGDVVEVYSEGGEYLATGHYNGGNIAIKILSFQKVDDIRQLFLERFKNAYTLRQTLHLTNNPETNCYRLVNAEGDGLPGLIVDWYNGTVVLQMYSVGMYGLRSLILECLQTVYGSQLQAVYDKSAAVLNKPELQLQNAYLSGAASEHTILEYGHTFRVNWEEGQKTGFFLDQRENRAQLARYVQGKRVLNTFCYSGGFSVYAMRAGATLVHSVDSSVKAIAWTQENVELNHPTSVTHAAFAADVFTFLKECEPEYDVIVLDPPAFAKNLSARHQAVMAYKRLNHLALTRLRPNGILFTFSCSQVVTPDLFRGGVVAGAIESRRQIQILDYLTQPPDHPVSLYHPEGLYLKGLVLAVE